MIQLIKPSACVIDNNNCPLFKNLSAPELQMLANAARFKVINEQQHLCSQSSPSDRVFNIISGAASVERISCNGRRQILGFVFPGDFVGLTNSDHFEYGVRSLGCLTAYEFPRKVMSGLVDTIPTLKENIKDIEGLVLSLTFDQVYLLGQKKADERLCFLFIHLLTRLPDATPTHIELPMNRLDIADYLGLTVETVSRSLTKLRKEGLISTPGPHAIQIHDINSVKERASIE